MGTNYYLQYRPLPDGPVKTLHVGKSSFGWRFCFHYIDGVAENVDQWKALLANGELYDAYDNRISQLDFWGLIVAKQDGKFLSDEDHSLINGYFFAKGEFS